MFDVKTLAPEADEWEDAVVVETFLHHDSDERKCIERE